MYLIYVFAFMVLVPVVDKDVILRIYYSYVYSRFKIMILHFGAHLVKLKENLQTCVSAELSSFST